MKSGLLRKLGLVPAVAAAIMIHGCEKAEDQYVQGGVEIDTTAATQPTTQPAIHRGLNGYYYLNHFYNYGSGPYPALSNSSSSSTNSAHDGANSSESSSKSSGSKSSRGGFGGTGSGHPGVGT